MLAATALLRAQTASVIAGPRQPGGTTTVPNPMWAAAGVTGGIPNVTTPCGSQLAASSSAAQFNTAISNCSSSGGGVVSLAAGTFNLSGGINMKSNVVLRGQGMSTVLKFTSAAGGTWYWGTAVVGFQGPVGGTTDGVPPIASAPSGTNRTWVGTNGQTGVYTQGATVINLGSAPTGLSVGATIILWQSNVPDASLPNSGFFFSAKCTSPCDGTASGSSAIASFGSYDDHGGSTEQRSTVTAINGSAITIDPGLVHPTGVWQSSLNPQARWFNVSDTIHDAGLESLLVDTTAMGAHQCDICIAFAKNVWVKGIGMRPHFTSFHAGGAVDYGIVVNDSHHVSVVNNWIDKMIGGGVYTTTSYGIAWRETHHFLQENNILNNVESPTELLIGSMGGVVAYNYELFTGTEQQEGGLQQHEVASSMNLVEGNRYMKVYADSYHGNTGMTTYFRNYITNAGFNMQSYHRWHNFIGNSINATAVYKTLATDTTKYNRWASYAFRLGYPQEQASNASSGGVGLDSGVWTSAMIWGNYAPVSGAQFNSSEVPTADPFLPNPVPPDHNLPASFYRSSPPGFFTIAGIGTQPWPLNGPDVTGGVFLTGHANKTPAQLVYEASGGNIANFNPGVYGAGAGAPSPPTNLRIVSNTP
jgi:Pectate lyase superfamily protein